MASQSHFRCRALYLEDSRDDQQILREAVSFADVALDLVTATTPAEALDLLRREVEFDVLLLDWNLPRMNGAEFLEQLRAIRPVLPVVILTGEPRLVDRSAALSLGAGLVLQKPLILEDWESLAHRLFDYCGVGAAKATVPGK